MGNKRKEIRQATKTLLENSSTLSYITSIFTNRQSNLSQTQHLPSITIFTSSEDATKKDVSGQTYIRQLDLTFEIRVDDTGNADDLVDNIMSDVENVILSNLDLSGTVLGTELSQSTIEVGFLGNKPIGFGTLTFRSTYVA